MSSRLGQDEPLSKRTIASYAFDYAIIIILVVASIELDGVEPNHQQFSLRNYSLQYEFRLHDRVPLRLLYLICIAGPAGIMAFWTLLVDGLFSHKVNGRKKKYTFRQRIWQLNAGLLGLGLAVSLQYVIVSTLKNLVGKPRPDLISRCQPRLGSEDPLPFGLSDHSICTQTDNSILKDGFRSFPSGHSATSFGGLFYLSMFLSAKLHVFDLRGEVWKIFVALIPTLGAALIAATRVIDARHHPFDVLAGCAIGLVVAWLSYRQYFPSPKDFRKKGRAYPIRTWTSNEALEDRPDVEDGDEGAEHGFGYTATERDEEDIHSEALSSAVGGGQRGGNMFRDEISRSQRQRQRTAARFNPPHSSGELSPVPPMPIITARGPQPSSGIDTNALDRPGVGSRQTSWEAVSGPTTDDESIQRLHNPQGFYDPVLSSDTSYRGAQAEKGTHLAVQHGEIDAQ